MILHSVFTEKDKTPHLSIENMYCVFYQQVGSLQLVLTILKVLQFLFELYYYNFQPYDCILLPYT